MRSEKYFCDRCGIEFVPNTRSEVNPSFLIFIRNLSYDFPHSKWDDQTFSTGKLLDGDYCYFCVEELRKLIGIWKDRGQ